MKLLFTYKSKDLIPAGFESLYTEQADGSYKMTAVEGIRTEAEYQGLQSRFNEKAILLDDANKALKVIDDAGIKLSNVPSLMTEMTEMREKLKGGKTDEQIQALVDTQVRMKTAELESQFNQTKTKLTELEKANAEYKQREVDNTISNEIRQACEKAGVTPTAMQDVLLRAKMTFALTDDGKVLTKEGVGTTGFASPEVWLTEIKESAPHWWPASNGSGAGGGNGSTFGGDNPWAKGSWNTTKQMEIISKDRNKAEQLASIAGSKIGATNPPA